MQNATLPTSPSAGVWANNEMSELLRQQGEQTSMRDMVMHVSGRRGRG